MSLNQSTLAHSDCRDAMDRALSAPNGVRLTLESPGQAINFRQRCYTARVTDRKAQARLYGPNDIRAGTSVYDTLSINVEACVVTIQKIQPGAMEIEEF